jgi:hypothetical protein
LPTKADRNVHADDFRLSPSVYRPGWSANTFSASGTPARPVEAHRSSVRIPFPARRIQRLIPKQHPPPDVLEEWARRLGLEKVLGPLILYQYKHLNGEDLSNLVDEKACVGRIRFARHLPWTKF